jgi:hypothetical protein
MAVLVCVPGFHDRDRIPQLRADAYGHLDTCRYSGDRVVPFMLGFMVLQWRRTYRQSPLLHAPLAGSVSPDKFVAEGVTGRTEMTWSQFVRIRDADDVVLLYQSPDCLPDACTRVL